MERYAKLDTLNLAEVEKELETILSIVEGKDNILPDTEKYINNLIGIAKALGSRKEW